MAKTSILFIHHAAGWGGAPINMINIINNLDKSKFDVHVLLLKDSIVKERLADSNIAYTVCDSSFYKKWYTYFSHTEAGYVKPFQLMKLIKVFSSWFLSKYVFAPKVLRDFSYDIIHLNSSVLSDWLKPSSKRSKVIYHIQEPISRGWFGIRYGFLRNQVQKYADKIIAISQDNAKRINVPHKTAIVYNFTELSEEVSVTNSPSVLYVGGAAKIKGIEVVASCVPFLNKDIKLVMVGHYPNLKPLSMLKKIAYQLLYPSAFSLRNKLEKIASNENVVFIGAVSSIKEVLQEASILISPFTVPHFSRPVIEAFANGKPVIASNVSGMDEVVEDGVNGILIENYDAKALASAINKLVSNEEMLRLMGENGRKKAIEFYTPEPNMMVVENVYTELMRSL